MKVWILHNGEIQQAEVIDYTYDLRGFCHPTGYRTENGTVILIIKGIDDEQTNNFSSDSFNELGSTCVNQCA